MGILTTAVVYLSMAAFVLTGTTKAPPLSRITFLRTPREGIQPQTVLDRKGVLHMIYFKGNASGGDIEYVWRNPKGKDFSHAIRVNSEERGARAGGRVGGPKIAVGRTGRVYVFGFVPPAPPGRPPARMKVNFP